MKIIAMENNNCELKIWQTEIINERLEDYYSNADAIENFDEMLDEIEESIL
jgi:hypothetical protein